MQKLWKKLYVASFYCPHCGQKLSQEFETSDKSTTQTDVPKQPLTSPDASKQLFNKKGKPFWLLLSVVILFVIIITHANFSENSNVSSKEVAEVPSYTFVEPLPEYYEAMDIEWSMNERYVEFFNRKCDMLKKGIDKGCYYCMAEYGSMYAIVQPALLKGGPRFTSYTEEAMQYLEEATEHNVPKAYSTLGEIYVAGLGGLAGKLLHMTDEYNTFVGVSQNVDLGLQYMEKAIELGLQDTNNKNSINVAFDVCFILGLAYEQGDIKGIATDYSKALLYTQKAVSIIDEYPDAFSERERNESREGLKDRIKKLEQKIR